MVALAVHLDQGRLKVRADLGEHPVQAIYRIAVEHFAPIFRHKDQMDVHLENAVPTVPNFLAAGHAVLACGGTVQSGRPAKQEPTEATTQEFALV